MKAICPNNKEHNLFITTAHVQEEWVVDSYGNFVETIRCTDITHGPDHRNVWICKECGEPAIFFEEY